MKERGDVPGLPKSDLTDTGVWRLRLILAALDAETPGRAQLVTVLGSESFTSTTRRTSAVTQGARPPDSTHTNRT